MNKKNKFGQNAEIIFATLSSEPNSEINDFEKIVDEILSVDNVVRHVAIIDYDGNIMHKKINENMKRLTSEMEDVAHAADLNIRKKMRKMLDNSLGRTTFIHSIRERIHELFFYTEYFQIYVTCLRNLDKQSIMRISDAIESIIRKRIPY
ncbi:MAG TPA: DUF6659 family protein [Nitrosopumilaceae archaeon]|nr:DUF6659 family protein [Nitrosopumilaceae archaeon]